MTKLYAFLMNCVIKSILKRKKIQPNRYEPAHEPGYRVLKSGHQYWNDVQYATVYPQSYLDIFVGETKDGKKRPTFFRCTEGDLCRGTKRWEIRTRKSLG